MQLCLTQQLCGACQVPDYELEQQALAQQMLWYTLLAASLCGACQVPDYELEQQALAYHVQTSQEGKQVPAAHAQQQQRPSVEGEGAAPGPSVDGSHPSRSRRTLQRPRRSGILPRLASSRQACRASI